jgi:cytochrome c biogenesis protein CcdA
MTRAPNSGLALAAGAAATAGFVLIFGLTGGILALGAFWLGDVLPWAGFAIGFALAVTGLFVLTGRHIGIRLPAGWPGASNSALGGDFLFGLGYGTASLSCTLPIFLSVTGVAATGGVLQSVLGYVAFGLGMGTIFTAIAPAAALSQDGLAASFKRFLPHAHKFSGAVLLLVGLYVIYYWGAIVLGPEIPVTSGIVGFAEQLSSVLRKWLIGDAGQTIRFALLGLFAVSIAWLAWRRQSNLKGNAG